MNEPVLKSNRSDIVHAIELINQAHGKLKHNPMVDSASRIPMKLLNVRGELRQILLNELEESNDTQI